MTTYIESGIYTNYTGKPAIYIGKYKTLDGELRNSFCDIPINIKETITREDIIEFLRENGTKIIECITLAPEYTGYDYGYIGKLPQDLYKPIKQMADDWSKKPWKEDSESKKVNPNMIYQEGGIYVKYNGQPAIYIGEYEDSSGVMKKCFCDVPMNFNKNTTQEDVVKFLRKKGTKVLNCIFMLHPDNTDYNYGCLGQLPRTLYCRIDKRAKAWSLKPWKKD